MVKVLKGLAEACDMTLGETLEDVVVHAFEGVSTFGPDELEAVAGFKKLYGLTYDVHANYTFTETQTTGSSYFPLEGSSLSGRQRQLLAEPA